MSPLPAIPRTMLAFHRDDAGEVYAELDCGHRRHIRHQPPLSRYPWVRTDEGRAARVGTQVECDRCAQRVWPDAVEQYSSTPIFDRESVPKALLGAHNTKAGVWARLEALAGEFDLVFDEPLNTRVSLRAGESAAIPPQLWHHIDLGAANEVRMQVHFFRRPA